jgi:hypothetical protein
MIRKADFMDTIAVYRNVHEMFSRRPISSIAHVGVGEKQQSTRQLDVQLTSRSPTCQAEQMNDIIVLRV